MDQAFLKKEFDIEDKNTPEDKIKRLEEELRLQEEKYDKLFQEHLDYQYDPEYMRIKI